MRLRKISVAGSSRARWCRRLAAGVSSFVALSLVAAVAPARSRDRGSSRAAARANGGSQRWEIHHDDCELPLHVTEADWHRLHALSSPGVSGAYASKRLLAALAIAASTQPHLAHVDRVVPLGLSLAVHGFTPRGRSRAPPVA